MNDDAMNWTPAERDLNGCGDYLPSWLTVCDCGAVTYDKDKPCPCECAAESEG